MVQSAEKLRNIHFEHLIWQNELQNYLIEIKIFDQRIQSLLEENLSDETHEDLRMFRDKFHELINHITNWKVEIGQHEYLILEIAKLNGAIRLITDSQHDDMRKKMQRLRKSMLKLKERFQYFLAKKI